MPENKVDHRSKMIVKGDYQSIIRMLERTLDCPGIAMETYDALLYRAIVEACQKALDRKPTISADDAAFRFDREV